MTDTDRLTVRTVSETVDQRTRRRITDTPDGTLTWWEVAGPLGAAVVTVRPAADRPVRATVHHRFDTPADNAFPCDFQLSAARCVEQPVGAAHLDQTGDWERQTRNGGFEPWWTLTQMYVDHLVTRGI